MGASCCPIRTCVVNKLAAILRIANALDAEHLQKVRDVRLALEDRVWLADLDATGDTTLETLAAGARADMFLETYGRPLVLRHQAV